MTKAKYWAVVVAIFFALGLAGCGSNPSKTADSGSSPAGNAENSGGPESSHASTSHDKVSIRFSWWGDPQRNKVYEGVIAEFEKKFPNIEVKGEPTSWGDYFNKLSTQVAGGNAPDVIGMHANNVGDFASRGALLDLDPFIQSGEIDMANFPESVQASNRFNGKTYMISQGVALMAEGYNQTLLDELHVSEPNVNWTWDEFMQKATEIRDAFVKAGKGDGHWGTDDQSSQLYPGFQYFLRQNGKDLYTEDGKLGFAKEDLVQWFTMWDGLRKAGVIPDAATSVQYSGASMEQGMYVKGLIGITAMPAHQVYLYQNLMPDAKLGLARIPTLAGGQSGELIAGAYLSISAKSKHPKEAAAFINFFVNNPDAGKIFKEEQGVPGSTAIAEVIKPLLNPAQQAGLQFTIDNLKYARPHVYPPQGAAQITKLFTDTAQAIAFQKASIEEASQQFIDEAGQILK